MRKVMLSIHPAWCQKIANNEKTFEIRKNSPSIDVPFLCYIYCTKKANLYLDSHKKAVGRYKDLPFPNDVLLSGKVIGEFVCDQIITVDCDSSSLYNKETLEDITLDTCISREIFWQYTHGNQAVGWHISKLEIYSEPKLLSEFGIKRPPQSWQYVR